MLLALAAGFGIYFLANAAGERLIADRYMSERAMNQRTYAISQELQSYVQENGLSSRDTDAISRWAISKKDVYILLYKDQHLALEAGWWGVESGASDSEEERESAPLSNSVAASAYPLYLRDGVFQAVIYEFSETKLYNLCKLGSLFLACAAAMLLLLLYNRSVTRRIAALADSVRKIGEGDLHRELVPEGCDELTVLAESIEQMRRSILQKTEEEQAALRQNSELVTAMSHDIRNPLTALLGYLDIAKNGQYRTPQELQSYLEAGYSKAVQLKKLTDELFRYTMLFGCRELPLNLEEYDAALLFEQLLSEGCAGLEQHGFQVRLELGQPSGRVRVDMVYFKRVLDNLFDNILKHAEPKAPVCIVLSTDGKRLTLSMENVSACNTGKIESNRIGLRTCSKIMEQLGGSFYKGAEAGRFRAEVSLPLLPEKDGN